MNKTHEFDEVGESVVEVMVLWGTNVLQVSHINESKSFSLNQLPVVYNNKLVVQPTSELEVNGIKRHYNELEAMPSTVAENSYELDIKPFTNYRIKVGKLTVVAKQVAQARKMVYTKKHDKTMLLANLFSAIAVFASILTMHVYANAASSSLLMQGNEEDRMNDLRAFIQRQQERQAQQQETQQTRSEQGASSAAHSGPSGQMGSRVAPARNARHSIRNNGELPHLSRQAARDAVANRGIFASIAASGGGTIGGASGIVSPFGGLTESGLDPQNFNGNLTGDSVGDSFGYGGLGPTGTGWGANGTGDNVIGVGTLNTNGRGGTGPEGFGTDRGTHLQRRGTHGPIVRAPAPTVVGLLPPEAIRRVVLRNLPQVVHCHEQGLVQNPTLEGRVVVRFIIGSQGTVLGSNVVESNIAVPSVAQCISTTVRRWQFPVPQGEGIVTVNYPFNLQRPE